MSIHHLARQQHSLHEVRTAPGLGKHTQRVPKYLLVFFGNNLFGGPPRINLHCRQERGEGGEGGGALCCLALLYKTMRQRGDDFDHLRRGQLSCVVHGLSLWIASIQNVCAKTPRFQHTHTHCWLSFIGRRVLMLLRPVLRSVVGLAVAQYGTLVCVCVGDVGGVKEGGVCMFFVHAFQKR